MGNLWSSSSSAKNHHHHHNHDHDHWNFSEEELRARHLFGGVKEDTTASSVKTAGVEAGERGRKKTKAETHCAYMIPTLLSMAQANPKLKILDVGCGSGEMSVDFALLCPDAHIVGLDISGAVLSSARVYAEARRQGGGGGGEVSFVQGSVYDMPEEWTGRFDVVVTHQVVAHLRERGRAVREMVRVARKDAGGGVVCMREGDLRSGRFFGGYDDGGGGGKGYHGDLEECFDVIVKVHEMGGGAADAGSRLKGWVMEAGVRKEDIVVSQSVGRYDTPEGRREYGGHWPGRCTNGVFAKKAMELGVSRERLQDYAVAWKRWIEDNGGMFAMLHGEVIIRVNQTEMLSR